MPTSSPGALARCGVPCSVYSVPAGALPSPPPFAPPAFMAEGDCQAMADLCCCGFAASWAVGGVYHAASGVGTGACEAVQLASSRRAVQGDATAAAGAATERAGGSVVEQSPVCTSTTMQFAASSSTGVVAIGSCPLVGLAKATCIWPAVRPPDLARRHRNTHQHSFLATHGTVPVDCRCTVQIEAGRI